MQEKLPYYMVYPMPYVYDDGRVEERDMEYMKSLYPDVAKRILPYVEEECDRMEYRNSMIYDEYPDRLQLRMMCRRVYDNVKKNEKLFFGTGYENMFMEKNEVKEGMGEMEVKEDYELTDQQMRRPMQPPRTPYPSRPSHSSRPSHPSRPSHTSRPPHQGRPDWLRDMIEIMLYQELMRRRRNNRRNRGWDRTWDFHSNP